MRKKMITEEFFKAKSKIRDSVIKFVDKALTSLEIRTEIDDLTKQEEEQPTQAPMPQAVQATIPPQPMQPQMQQPMQPMMGQPVPQMQPPMPVGQPMQQPPMQAPQGMQGVMQLANQPPQGGAPSLNPTQPQPPQQGSLSSY
jgi:hypothetical protein